MIISRRILNIDILSISKHELLSRLDSGVIFTPNVDHLIKLQKDKEFYTCYQQADHIVCDSKIVSFAAKFLKTPIKEVIPGSDLFPLYCKQIASQEKKNKRIFLLGGTNESITKKAIRNLHKQSNYKFIVGSYCPPFGFESNESEKAKIIELIRNSRANVIAVGVGAPKQEKFIFEIKKELPQVNTYFAIGATIDFISGELKRAPKWMQRIGMEWFFRMLIDPKRLVKRYIIDDLPFFWLILKQKLNKYKNPFDKY